MHLLTTSNPKTQKGEAQGWLTAGLHLAPHKVAGFNVCGYASKGCAAGCLNLAGRGRMHVTQDARIRRTLLFRQDRAAFMSQLRHDLDTLRRKAEREGMQACARLNVLSDLPWEKLCPELFDEYADVQFYDYTKWPIHKRGKLPANYSLTFSLAEDNDQRARMAHMLGYNVAVVFATPKGQPLPDSYDLLGTGNPVPVIDGDESDLRFLDPSGVIVGLRAKGPAINDQSGFVRSA
jgi:hypothetical protein